MTEFITVRGKVESIKRTRVENKFVLKVQGMLEEFMMWNQRAHDIKDTVVPGDEILFSTTKYRPIMFNRKEWRLEGTKPTTIIKSDGTRITFSLPKSSPYKITRRNSI